MQVKVGVTIDEKVGLLSCWWCFGWFVLLSSAGWSKTRHFLFLFTQQQKKNKKKGTTNTHEMSIGINKVLGNCKGQF